MYNIFNEIGKGIIMNLGENIKKIRKLKGLTLKEMSLKTGITSSFLSDIENCKKLPSIDTLSKLSQGLNVPLYVLFKELASSEHKEGCGISHEDNFILQAKALFMSDKLSREDKEKIFKDISDFYWEAKGLSSKR